MSKKSNSADKLITVNLGARSYPIHIGSGNILRVDLSKYLDSRQVLIVSNETVAPLYLEILRGRLNGKHIQTVILPDGEQFKNLKCLDTIITALLTEKHSRQTTLIALGGGVIGDITGFAAATYQRGVSFVQIPTTLLAQVDSAVGGKTGVNHKLGKNMIGAFYQPKAVIIDTETLRTLPDREFLAGLSEIIKYGLIADVDFFNWLESEIEELIKRDAETLTYAIAQSCRIKAAVVSADETEKGMRAILNLGHTFGHAIETFLDYRVWVHGEAVAAGMMMAVQLSALLGHLDNDDVNRVSAILVRCGLPTRPPSTMKTENFLDLMQRDKKVVGNKLRLVLLESLGTAIVTSDFSKKDLKSILGMFCGAD